MTPLGASQYFQGQYAIPPTVFTSYGSHPLPPPSQPALGQLGMQRAVHGIRDSPVHEATRSIIRVHVRRVRRWSVGHLRSSQKNRSTALISYHHRFGTVNGKTLALIGRRYSLAQPPLGFPISRLYGHSLLCAMLSAFRIHTFLTLGCVFVISIVVNVCILHTPSP